MHELKFRAWNPTTKMMSTGHIGLENAYCFVPGCEMLQFTGLKDKNGIEIYEGDIVANAIEITKTKRSGGSVQIIYTGQYTTTVAAVRWNDWWGQWDLMAEGIHQRGRIEVIGNIYENPELLEKPLTTDKDA